MKNWFKRLVGRQTPKSSTETGPQKAGERVGEKDLIKGIETDLSFIKLRLAPQGEASSFRTRDGKMAKMSQNRDNINRIMGRIRDGKLNVRGELLFSGYREGVKDTDTYSRWHAEAAEVPAIWCYNNTALHVAGRAFQFIDPAGVRPERVLMYPFLPQQLDGHDGNSDDALKSFVNTAKAEGVSSENPSEDELLEYADGYTLGVISAVFKRLTPNAKTPQLEEMLRLLSEQKE